MGRPWWLRYLRRYTRCKVGFHDWWAVEMDGDMNIWEPGTPWEFVHCVDCLFWLPFIPNEAD